MKRKILNSKLRDVYKGTLLLFFWLFSLSFAVASQKVYKWGENGIRIELKEYLDIPEMKWPVTLLHYRIDLSGAQISDPGSLSLIGDTGRPIPFN